MSKPQNSRFSVKHRPKLKIRQNFPNVRISPGFWLIKEENDISNIYSKFQDHKNNIFIYFFQNGDDEKNHVFTWENDSHVTYPLVFDSLPYTG